MADDAKKPDRQGCLWREREQGRRDQQSTGRFGRAGARGYRRVRRVSWIGENKVAVPWDQLNVTKDRVTVNMTEDQVKAAPHWDKNQPRPVRGIPTA